jgi:ABC-type branched-subunit amino acid transport system substrate-binding protein
MTRPTPLWRTVAAIGAAGLVLTACGGEETPTTAPPADSETSAESTAEETDAAAPTEADGVLTIGTILPQTGSLAFLGPPEFAGVELAVQEINEAGGVLGEDVALFQGDSGDTSTDIASQTVDRLLGENADVIIGAASSSVSLTVIDAITGAGVVQISPANTSPAFTTYDDDGLYFRTAPSDVLQGRVLGNTILADGNQTLGIISLQDAYGEGLVQYTTEAFESAGGQVVATEFYDPNAAEFSAEVQAIAAADPQAIVLIGFDESSQVISEMISQGIGPQEKPLYLVDGNTGNALGEDLPAGVLEGVQGTLPGAEAPDEFRERLLEIDPDLQDYSYAGESYDAAIVAALAAIAAESDAGLDVASELVNVTGEGTVCTEFAQCKEMLEAGEDIDYDGISGPIAFDEAGDPTIASVGIYTYGPDNTLLPDARYETGEI